MSGTIMPTAAPATPIAASPTSAVEAVDVDRQAPFGPALARAREQVPRRPVERRSGAADETAEPATDDDERAPSGATGDDEPIQDPAPAHRPPSVAAASVAAASSTVASDAAASVAAASVAAASSTAASDVAASVAAASTTGPAPSSAAGSSADATETAQSTEISQPAAAASVPAGSAVSDRPTAKGTVGDGGPSTSPTVEGTAPPSMHASAPAPAGAISATLLASESTDSVDPAGGGGATANQSTQSDTPPAIDMQAASAIMVDGEGDDVGPSTGGATEPARVPAVATTTVAPHPPARAELDWATPVASGLVVAENVSPLSTEADSPVSAPDESSLTPTSAVHRSAHSAAADAAEGLAMLAREVGQSTEAARSIAAATPPPGQLDAAEGSLWDDVRIAFDRIRNTGDAQEVRIRLRPAELGDLVVQVRTHGDQIAVRLTASSPAAHQALIDDRLRLAAELARAGFEGGSVDIGRDDGGGLGHHGQGTDDERSRGRMIPERSAGVVERSAIERRDPIRTESGVRPGRHANSTINLTL